MTTTQYSGHRGVLDVPNRATVDPEAQRKARLFVASNAHDADDCRMLLAMLGLEVPA